MSLGSTLIIAEGGVNHNGCLQTALDLVDAARECGADIIKFQIALPHLVATSGAEKAQYQIANTATSQSQLEMIKELILSDSDVEKVYNHARKIGIEFLLTAFDPVSVRKLQRWPQRWSKVASGEVTNVPLLREIAKQKRPILLSTGMSTLSEVEFAIKTLTDAGADRSKLTVMHCNTEYPTPLEDVNLHAIQTLKNELNVDVGYSDHTLSVDIPVAAVALGSCVIEKHLTLNQSFDGPDHQASLEPNLFKEMVSKIRAIEVALGDGIKRPSASEVKNIAIARRSIVASTKIKLGERFSESNLSTKRPGLGISPTNWDKLLGMYATRDYDEDELIQW